MGKPGPISNKDKVSNKEKETPIVTLPEDFKLFWNQYGKKVSRDKCFKLWKKLSNRDKTEIFVVLPDYVASTPEIKYRKNPETWLRNRGWEDQIIPQKPKVDSNGPVGRFS